MESSRLIRPCLRRESRQGWRNNIIADLWFLPVRTCTYTCTCTHLYMHVYTLIHARVHTYTYMHLHTPIHARAHTYTCTQVTNTKSLIFGIYKLWRDYLQICCTFKQNTRTVEEEESPQLPDTYAQALSWRRAAKLCPLGSHLPCLPELMKWFALKDFSFNPAQSSQWVPWFPEVQSNSLLVA